MTSTFNFDFLTLQPSEMVRAIIIAACVLLAAGQEELNDHADKAKAVRMRTSRQLKEIFDDLGISYSSSMAVKELREIALEEDAVTRYEEKYPEKKKKKRAPGGFGGGGIPEGVDPKAWADVLSRMGGDFSQEQDPEKRRILEKLQQKGMNLGGQDMDIEQLRKLEQMLDGISAQGFPGSDEPKDDL